MSSEKSKVIIGTRTSPLALWQANYVKSVLEKYPFVVELKEIITKGDKILDKPLAQLGDKGLFTKELENALLDKTIDIAVHSLKDIPTEIPDGLMLAAVTKRGNPEDVLVGKYKLNSINDLNQNARIATGSLRRKAQLLHQRKDLQISDLRGNIATRLKKLWDNDFDAIVMAKTALERLGKNDLISYVIPKQIMVPAVGQAALGIEIRSDNPQMLEVVNHINDLDTWICISAERAFLHKVGGGCKTPIGAYAEIIYDELHLDAVICSEDAKSYFRNSISGNCKDNIEIGIKLGEIMLDSGAKQILKCKQ